MMGDLRRQLTVVFVTLGTMFLAAHASADSPAEKGSIQTVASGLNPTNWRMPQWKLPSFSDLMPGQEDKTRIVKKKDSLFDDMSKTASKSWAKTKQALDPRRLNPMNWLPAEPVRPTPKSNPSPGFFSSLFGNGTQTATRPTGTVTEFLGQPKINR